MKKLWSAYIVEAYAATRRDEHMQFALTQNNQRENDKYWIISPSVKYRDKEREETVLNHVKALVLDYKTYQQSEDRREVRRRKVPVLPARSLQFPPQGKAQAPSMVPASLL